MKDETNGTVEENAEGTVLQDADEEILPVNVSTLPSPVTPTKSHDGYADVEESNNDEQSPKNFPQKVSVLAFSFVISLTMSCPWWKDSPTTLLPTAPYNSTCSS